jgi:hypothetical protein
MVELVRTPIDKADRLDDKEEEATMTVTEVARVLAWLIGNLLPWCIGVFVILRWFLQELRTDRKRISGS